MIYLIGTGLKWKGIFILTGFDGYTRFSQLQVSSTAIVE